MEESNAMPDYLEKPSKTGVRTILLGSLILVLMLLAGFLAYRAWSAWQGSAAPAFAERLSAEDLAARYGLRVRLIRVTAGGGMIDFRLKILDAEKARQLLSDPGRKPTLIAVDSGVELTNPADAQKEPLLENGGILFALFPNSGSAIQPGDEVIVAFGDLQLEPMVAE